MPTYTIRCIQCGMERDVMVHERMSEAELLAYVDDSNVVCGKCDGDFFEKVATAPGIKVNGYNEANGYGLRDSER